MTAAPAVGPWPPIFSGHGRLLSRAVTDTGDEPGEEGSTTGMAGSCGAGLIVVGLAASGRGTVAGWIGDGLPMPVGPASMPMFSASGALVFGTEGAGGGAGVTGLGPMFGTGVEIGLPPGTGIKVTFGGVGGGGSVAGRMVGGGARGGEITEMLGGTGWLFSAGGRSGTRSFFFSRPPGSFAGRPAVSGGRDSPGSGAGVSVLAVFLGVRQATSTPQHASTNPSRQQREEAFMRFRGKGFGRWR